MNNDAAKACLCEADTERQVVLGVCVRHHVVAVHMFWYLLDVSSTCSELTELSVWESWW